MAASTNPRPESADLQSSPAIADKKCASSACFDEVHQSWRGLAPGRHTARQPESESATRKIVADVGSGFAQEFENHKEKLALDAALALTTGAALAMASPSLLIGGAVIGGGYLLYKAGRAAPEIYQDIKIVCAANSYSQAQAQEAENGLQHVGGLLADSSVGLVSGGIGSFAAAPEKTVVADVIADTGASFGGESGEAANGTAVAADRLNAAANAKLPPLEKGNIRLFRGVKAKASETEGLPPLSESETARFQELLSQQTPYSGEGLTPAERTFYQQAFRRMSYNGVRFYSDNPQTALAYATENGNIGAVYALDVPESLAWQSTRMTFMTSLGQGSSVAIPYDVAKSAVQIAGQEFNQENSLALTPILITSRATDLSPAPLAVTSIVDSETEKQRR